MTLYPHEYIRKYIFQLLASAVFVLTGIFIGGMLFVPDEFPNVGTDIFVVALMFIFGFVTSTIRGECDD